MQEQQLKSVRVQIKRLKQQENQLLRDITAETERTNVDLKVRNPGMFKAKMIQNRGWDRGEMTVNGRQTTLCKALINDANFIPTSAQLQEAGYNWCGQRNIKAFLESGDEDSLCWE